MTIFVYIFLFLHFWQQSRQNARQLCKMQGNYDPTHLHHVLPAADSHPSIECVDLAYVLACFSTDLIGLEIHNLFH